MHARLVPGAERSSKLCSLNNGSVNVPMSCRSHFFLHPNSHAAYVWREPKDAFHSHCDWAAVKHGGGGYGMPKSPISENINNVCQTALMRSSLFFRAGLLDD